MQLRRLGWLSRDHELVDTDGRSLAQLRLTAFREAAEILAVDGRTWSVRRQPNFGPWHVTDEAGTVLVTVAKDGLRERFDVTWPAGSLRLERRANLGQRRMDVLDGASGAKVGEIRQRGFSGRTTDLDLPVAPDEVLAAVGWVVAMLAQRDASVAAQN